LNAALDLPCCPFHSRMEIFRGPHHQNKLNTVSGFPRCLFHSMGSLFRGSHHRKKLKVAPVFLIIPRVGQNHIYIRCVYGLFGREFTIYTVIYGVYIRFWPTLIIPCPPPPDSSSLNWPHCLFTPPTQTPSNILVWLIAFVWLSLVWFIAFHTPYSDTLKSLCMAHCLFHSRGSLT